MGRVGLLAGLVVWRLGPTGTNGLDYAREAIQNGWDSCEDGDRAVAEGDQDHGGLRLGSVREAGPLKVENILARLWTSVRVVAADGRHRLPLPDVAQV